MKYLLDTHVLVWWHEKPERLSRSARRALSGARAGAPLVVSDITLWEIGNLYSLGRLQLTMGLQTWLSRAVAAPLVHRVGITPEIAAEIAALPASFHRDPADRLLVATARVLGLKLITEDERIIDAALCPTL